MECFTLGFTRKIPGFPMVNSWFPGRGPLANPWKPGVFQDSRNTPGFQWNRGKCIFSPGIYQGESWKTGAAARPEFQLFSSYIPGIPQVYPRYSPGFWWKVSFPPGFCHGKHQGFSRFLPGVYQVAQRVTKNLVFTWGKPGILVRAKKTW